MLKKELLKSSYLRLTTFVIIKINTTQNKMKKGRGMFIGITIGLISGIVVGFIYDKLAYFPGFGFTIGILIGWGLEKIFTNQEDLNPEQIKHKEATMLLGILLLTAAVLSLSIVYYFYKFNGK